MSAPTVDLEVLRRSAPAAEPPRRGGRFVAFVLVAGALGWAFLLARDWILPPRSVATARVTADTGPSARRASTFEATGWVEPDPFAVAVRPLVDGVVEAVEVVEGQAVEAGKTVLARLRDVPLESELARLEKELPVKAAAVAEADADVAEATRLLELKLELRADVARMEGDLRVAEAERAAATAEVAVAQRELEVARTELSAQDALERGGGGVPVARAKAAVAVAKAEAELAARHAAVDRAQAAVASATAQLSVAADALAHPVALEATKARALARQARAKAEVAAVDTALSIARANVARLTVVSPADGLVLRRETMPGSAVGPAVGMRGGAATDPSEGAGGAVVTLYDPRRLQVRVNVPLASVGSVGRDQAVEVTLDALPGRTFHGVVYRLVSQADRNNNTLEAKVRVADPDPLMKPEMVVRARFLAPEPPADAPAAVRLLVPKAAVRGDAVFVIDPTHGGRARRVPVVRVGEDGDRVEVRGDLSATHRVILEPVEDGDRVKDGGGA